MTYISSKEASEKWGISRVRVVDLIHEGKIPGARLVGKSWLIPADAEKPYDGRRKEKETKVFHFPLPIYNNYKEDDYRLTKEEQILWKGLDQMFQGRFQTAKDLFLQLLKSKTNFYVRFGAIYGLILSSMLLGDAKTSVYYLNTLHHYMEEDFPYKKECRLLEQDITAFFSGEHIFIKEDLFDPFYNYHPDAIPYIMVLNIFSEAIANLSKKECHNQIFLYHLLAKNYRDRGYFLASQSIFLYSAYLYKMQEKQTEVLACIQEAMSIAKQTSYYLIPASTYIPLSNEFALFFKDHDEKERDDFLQSVNSLYSAFRTTMVGMKIKPILFSITPESFMLFEYARSGKTNKEIAALVGLSENTIGKRYASLFAKMNVHNKKELVEHFLKRIYEFEKE